MSVTDEFDKLLNKVLSQSSEETLSTEELEGLNKTIQARTEVEGIRLESTSDVLDFIACEICRSVNAQFTIKGGYALSKLLERPRLTHDVDFSVETKEDYEEFKEAMRHIGDVLIEHKLIDRYIVKEEIQEFMSGGADYILNNAKLFGIDISLHQVRLGTRKYTLSFGEATMFCPERMLADKISATLSRKRFRRIKDIYDLYCIIKAMDIDYELLSILVADRLKDTMELWDNIPFTETVIVQMQYAYNKLDVRNYFTGKQEVKDDFNIVCREFYNFVQPLKSGERKTTWNHRVLSWE